MQQGSSTLTLSPLTERAGSSLAYMKYKATPVPPDLGKAATPGGFPDRKLVIDKVSLQVGGFETGADTVAD